MICDKLTAEQFGFPSDSKGRASMSFLRTQKQVKLALNSFIKVVKTGDWTNGFKVDKP